MTIIPIGTKVNSLFRNYDIIDFSTKNNTEDLWNLTKELEQ